MSALALRIIACLAMLIDHIGYVWGISELRYIGRIAFPIFAFLIVNGYRHTRSVQKYMLRLAVFAVISEVPCDLLFRGGICDFSKQNVFVTLFLGLSCIAMIDIVRKRHLLLTLIPVAVFCAAAMAFNCDYGYIGILTVVAFHLFYESDAKSRVLLTLSMLLLSSWYAVSYNAANVIFDLTGCNLRGYWFLSPFFFDSPQTIQIYRVFALIPIFMYTGKKGWQPKSKAATKALQYGFYAFYPAHLLILYLLKQYA